MGRKPRVEYSGGIYHVIQRGNNREYIFEEESEKEFWLDQIGKMKTGMEYKVYGYVIMNNHYHLLLQTLGASLQKIMHRLNTRYSKYYNYRRDRINQGDGSSGNFLDFKSINYNLFYLLSTLYSLLDYLE